MFQDNDNKAKTLQKDKIKIKNSRFEWGMNLKV